MKDSMKSIKAIYSEDAPKPVGTYSQAIQSNGMVFLSGQVALDTEGKLVGEDVETQTKQILKNIEAILAAAECSVSNVVKVTLFLKNIADFKAVNTIYGEWVGSPAPARTTVEVSKLPLNALIEIECIAVL